MTIVKQQDMAVLGVDLCRLRTDSLHVLDLC
jgi:hypothetical protein